jgi:ubiquinol oxidase
VFEHVININRKKKINIHIKIMNNSEKHYKVKNLSDWIALNFTKFLRFLADTFFKKRYGHRAVVLETVAAVPGMVGGMLLHLKSLRKMEDDKGWIKILLDEAANERMHLMTFIEIAKPSFLERTIIMMAQFIFIIMYLLIYLISPRTAHRIVGYFEEEAVVSYTDYLNELENGKIKDQPAPEIAINYWNLPLHATLKDVVRVIRDDEAGHRDVNHKFANILDDKKNHRKNKSSQKNNNLKENKN